MAETRTPGEIVAAVRARYAEDIFLPPTPDGPVDRYSAAGARTACDAIARELHEEGLEHLRRPGPRTTFVHGRGDVPLRSWQVDLVNMSEPSLARCMRALIACSGKITDIGTYGGRVDDWRATVLLMVSLPDGLLARFREIARPREVSPPTRINLGMHFYRCGVEGCEEQCPPGHHGGTEWRAVDEERRRGG